MSVSLTPEQLQALDGLIFAGKKIEAIKLHRTLTNGELLLSKQFVEERERELRESHPGRFSLQGKSPLSCIGLLVILLFPIIAAIVFAYCSRG